MENNQMVKLERMQNTAGTTLSENAYNAVIGLTVLWGIIVNILMSTFLSPFILGIDYRVVLILYIVLSLACVMLVYKSNTPVVSFLGFTGLAFAMGMLLTFYLTVYSGRSIYNAFIMTGIIVVVMLLVSTIYPTFFLSIGRALGLALIGSLIVSLICGMLLRLHLGIMDYAVVVIFAGYIGYDWAKAQAYPPTLDNAIDSAADIYVDIINIFIRILRIVGKKND